MFPGDARMLVLLNVIFVTRTGYSNSTTTWAGGEQVSQPGAQPFWPLRTEWQFDEETIVCCPNKHWCSISHGSREKTKWSITRAASRLLIFNRASELWISACKDIIRRDNMNEWFTAEYQSARTTTAKYYDWHESAWVHTSKRYRFFFQNRRKYDSYRNLPLIA